MKPWQICKADRNYILVRIDDPIPALGERFFHGSVRAALQAARDETLDMGFDPADVMVLPNTFASAELIKSFGLTVAE